MAEQIILGPAQAQKLADQLRDAAAILQNVAASLESSTGPAGPSNLKQRVVQAVAKISGRSHRPGATFREIQRMLHTTRDQVGATVHDLQEQRLLHVQPYKPWIGRPTQVVLLAH